MNEAMSEKEQNARAYYRADEQIVNRELFAVYLAAFLGTLVENFPRETTILLDEYADPNLSNMSGASDDDNDIKKSLAFYPEEKRIHDMYKRYHDRRNQKMRVARGTLVFALKYDLIDSPEREKFLADPYRSSLSSCTLTKNAHDTIFGKQAQDIDAMMKSVAKDLGSSDSESTSAPSLFKLVARAIKSGVSGLKDEAKDQLKEQVKEHISKPAAAALNTIMASMFASIFQIAAGGVF